MHITQIQAENFLGIRSADVALQKPVTLFAGANYAGKSSLQEAVRMALTGESVRVSLKKEYAALVNDKASNGYVQVVMRVGERESSASMMLPAGKASAEGYAMPAPLPYVLDAQRFARLDDKERRAFLFGLMGLKTDLPSVKERLLAKKLDAAKVEKILPILRAGFDSASTDAKKKATEAKGAWRALTGETYGAVKAASWQPEKPEFDTAVIRTTGEKLAQLDAQVTATSQALGGLLADQRHYHEQQARLEGLREKAATVERIRTKLAKDEADLAEWESKVVALEGAGAPQTKLECPGCKALLVLKDGALIHANAQEPPADVGKLPQYRTSRDLLKSSVANDKRDLSAAEAAATEIKAIEEAMQKAPTPSEVDDARAKQQRLQGQRIDTSASLDKLNAVKRAAEAADEKAKQAGGHHADVAAWDAIGDALAPDGIPGELLAEALGPINERLAQSSLDAEWPLVVIAKDMAVTAAGRSYALLSESEKWRVDAMVAEAISFQSKLKLLVLDRFDVLDSKGRTDLLAWLDVLATNGEIETGLLFGTLKALPADLPATVAGEWIHNGHVGPIKEAA